MTPYIPLSDRAPLESWARPRTAGELNYVISRLCVGFVRDYIRRSGMSYQVCNDVVGALDNVKDEFRRRVQHPYEDQKIEENGDIFEPILSPTEGRKLDHGDDILKPVISPT